jgi:hypothetical protein
VTRRHSEQTTAVVLALAEQPSLALFLCALAVVVTGPPAAAFGAAVGARRRA